MGGLAGSRAPVDKKAGVWAQLSRGVGPAHPLAILPLQLHLMDSFAQSACIPVPSLQAALQCGFFFLLVVSGYSKARVLSDSSRRPHSGRRQDSTCYVYIYSEPGGGAIANIVLAKK